MIFINITSIIILLYATYVCIVGVLNKEKQVKNAKSVDSLLCTLIGVMFFFVDSGPILIVTITYAVLMLILISLQLILTYQLS